MHMHALQANVKPVYCKFKSRTFSVRGSNSTNQKVPVLYPQQTILALGRCQRLLSGSLYGHFHVIYWIMRQRAVLPFFIVPVEKHMTVYAGHVSYWPVGSLLLIRWHCTSVQSNSNWYLPTRLGQWNRSIRNRVLLKKCGSLFRL